MKKKSFLLGIASLMFANISIEAQTAPAAKEWDASIYGWARIDYMFDSRQNANVREYNLNLYPLDEKLDANGKDINDAGGSNFLAITSRLGVKFRGPDVWGAKATGTVEGDFFGNTELNKSSAGSGSIGLFRLRHAYANLAWEKTSITFGQTWYPTFVPEVYPGVANFNTGIMFNPFGWAGQVRVKQKLTSELSLDLVAYKDREFQVPNATGASANSATLNSSIPTFHGQLQYKGKKVTAGVGAEYQSLQPVIESNNLVSNEKVNSSTVFGYFKYADEKFIAKAYGISGGNLHHLVMLGGFAGYAGTVETYKPVKTTAFWVDLASAHPKIAPGVFFGYTKNGGVDAGYKSLYVRGVSGTRVVDQVWRASARVDFKQNKFKISPEIEYTAAKWDNIGTDATGNGTKPTDIGNLRVMASVMYSF